MRGEGGERGGKEANEERRRQMRRKEGERGGKEANEGERR
jgi:hypothetical protein